MDTIQFLVDKYHLCTQLVIGVDRPIEIPGVHRDDLARWARELDFKTVVEIGVAAGVYARVICRENPQAKYWGVDPWRPYSGYKDYNAQSEFDGLKEKAHKRMKSYENCTFLEEYSMFSVNRFSDNSVDFVYLDGNHTDPFITQDLKSWYPKVRPGGFLAGHDYTKLKHTACDVIPAVNRFVSENAITSFFVLGTHAKTPGVFREKVRSWLIVK